MQRVATPRQWYWILLLLFAGCMTANEPQIESLPHSNEIRVEDAKARSSILPNGNSAVYLKIVNPKDQTDW